jgi:hypothetical protein
MRNIKSIVVVLAGLSLLVATARPVLADATVDRIGFVDTKGDFRAKQGALTADWVMVAHGVKAAVISGNRTGITAPGSSIPTTTSWSRKGILTPTGLPPPPTPRR